MSSGLSSTDQLDSAESVLREELARGDMLLGSVAPILRHLLVNDDSSMFGDEIIARVRGMTGDVARQLVHEVTLARGAETTSFAAEDVEAVSAALVRNPAFLSHVHALALEWALTERLRSRLSLDPVRSPLLQALIGSHDEATSGLAMKFLAAQARYCQSQRRMTVALGELPGDLLHGALLALRAVKWANDPVDAAESTIRRRYDEGVSRLGLIARLVTGMGAGAVAALAVGHAGVAIFLSALALASGQDRDLAALSTSDSQMARMTLALRAAGLKQQAVEEQLLALHPESAIPADMDGLGADRAAAILAVSGDVPGS